jgi:hypothetical protein
MTRYLDPVLLWTVATTATSRVRACGDPDGMDGVTEANRVAWEA